MAISEEKMRIVVKNYFQSECDANTSIRQAFEKGFRPGVKKGQSADRPTGKWINVKEGNKVECDQCGHIGHASYNFCPICGADMKGENK